MTSRETTLLLLRLSSSGRAGVKVGVAVGSSLYMGGGGEGGREG